MKSNRTQQNTAISDYSEKQNTITSPQPEQQLHTKSQPPQPNPQAPQHPKPPPGHTTTGHNPVHAPLPGLGLRSLKTALAAMLTALLYAFLPDSNPTFACIGAVFGMGADMEESRRSGGNRFFGTIIGGFIGLGLYWLEHLAFPEGCYWLRLPLIFLGIVILIALCVLFHWPGGVQPGGVVLCIILFNTPAHHIDYAIHRMLDTGVGVLIALAVNYLLPRNRLEHWFHLEQKKKEENR
nr:aromatic acid exporter family protein [uncultured Acetatifactor sp.]